EPHEAADYATKHDFRAYGTNSASCGPGMGLYCHSDSSTPLLGDVRYVDTLHAASKPGNANCTSCHSASAPPSTYSCATVGCHPAANVPHNKSAKHDARTVTHVENASCLSCHADFTDLIAHGGCAKCHGNAILTANNTRYLVGTFTARCIDCHNISLDLDGAGPAPLDYGAYDPNHYEPYLVNHTADIAADSVVTGGSTITTKSCTVCHETMLKAEHAITLSASGDMSVNCIECHTDTTLGSAAQVTAKWTNNKCSDCHGATHGGSGMAIHDMSASAGSLGCSDSGCHTNTSDLALLHADSVKTGDPATTSCNLCHASADTDLSAITGCDSCHAPHDMTVHQITTDTGNCGRCHGNDGTPANDVRGIHATCATCHDNASYPGIITGKTSNCVECHTTGLVAEPHAGSGGNYSPYDANHYVGTESTHTASAAQAATVYDGFACSACHRSEMKPEHFKASSLVPGIDKCVGCHEVKVDALGTWDDTCDACHTATPHTERTTKHDVTASSCTENSGCHDNDISVIHDASIPANSMTPDCATCHTNDTTVPTELDCGA
ncbi:MAG: hypothetical protein Q8K89_03325, partial [Actinomycetota bacterium]|nr:hypothetical protein [Actinomycetota bacterium]